MPESLSTSPILLVSLGTSPAIVPEAFLLPDVQFQAVHVITTASTQVDFVQEWFAAHAPDILLSITRVDGFEKLSSEEDHFRFEEILYRWILETNTRPEDRYVCVAGGFKTMSAAMQKAAAVLGAAKVFHVLAEELYPGSNDRKRPAASAEEIADSQAKSGLHWICLGPEGGWPQLRTAAVTEYPLEVVKSDGSIRWVRASDRRFRERLREIVERSHRIAGAWDRLPDLPFPELATWSERELAWLASPLNPADPLDQNWVARLPKVELHCHLGGFATSGELLTEVRSAAEREPCPPPKPIETPTGWPFPAQGVGLERYRALGDNNGSVLLRHPGCLRRQCEILYRHLLSQGVRYAEIRCSPANYADVARGRSPWTILADIKAAFDAAMNDARAAKSAHPSAPEPCHVNLLIIGTRQAQGDFRTAISRHLMLAINAAEHWLDESQCRVVGVDLAGYEDKETRAHYFRDDFRVVHRAGLALTVHAGENDDAEGIWSAVFDLNTRRIGHALTLRQSPELLRSVADRAIAVEMCPFANLQIRGYPLDDAVERAAPPSCYPLQDYLRAGVRVTINTDNIGISAASLTDNLLLAARLCPGLTRLDLLRLLRNALDAAFVPAVQRSTLFRELAAAIPKP